MQLSWEVEDSILEIEIDEIYIQYTLIPETGEKKNFN